MDERQERRGRAQTVLGLISPTELGPTLMHEHLLLDLTPPSLRAAGGLDETATMQACDCFKITWGQKMISANYKLQDRDILLAELMEMRAVGGRSLVELTVGGLAPDPRGLASLAQQSGVHIIMGCGQYVEEYQPDSNARLGAEDFAREIIECITIGAPGTDIRAGIIGEIGCQYPWTQVERRVMEGALLAQAQTGAAVNAHPGRAATQPFELVQFVRDFGGRLDRFIISHIDRTLFRLDDLLRLAESGCVIEFDLFGWEVTNYYPNPDIDMPNDGMRLKLIRGLLDHGHLDQIVISHDICTQSRLCHYGGHGYQHIFANVLPLMLRRNFDEREIDAIMVKNPARLLAFV